MQITMDGRQKLLALTDICIGVLRGQVFSQSES